MKKFLIIFSSVLVLLTAGILLLLSCLLDGDSPVLHRTSPDPFTIFRIAGKLNRERTELQKAEVLPEQKTFSLTEEEFNASLNALPLVAELVSAKIPPGLQNTLLTLDKGVFHLTHAEKTDFPSGKYLNLRVDFLFEYDSGREKLTVLSAHAGRIPLPRGKVQELLSEEIRKRLSEPAAEEFLRMAVVRLKAENGNLELVYRPRNFTQILRMR